MTTAYTSLLGLALPVQGELAGTWGDMVDNAITSVVDVAVAGTQSITGDNNVTLTVTNGNSSATNLAQVGSGTTGSAQYAVINCTGARTAARTVTVPASSREYTVINATTGGYAVNIVGAGPTTGVSVANGEKCTIAWNGSDFVKVSSSLVSQLSGTLGVANGGTGQTTYTDGQLLIGNSSGNTLTKATLTAGSGVTITNGNGSISIAATGSGGTVTAVSVASANGFTGTSSGGTTPALTLATSVTGLLKGNGTAMSAATAGTDYALPMSVSGISTNTAAAINTIYVFTASLTLTLPASPAVGDRIGFANFSGTTTCTIARNGKPIMAIAQDMTVDNVNYFGTLVYADATRGWIFQ